MGNLLIKVIFSILNFLSGIFFLPLKPILLLVPSLSTFFTSIVNFMNYGLNYLEFFLKLLMIPKGVIVAVFTFGLAVFTFNMTIRVVGLGMSIYHYFKP